MLIFLSIVTAILFIWAILFYFLIHGIAGAKAQRAARRDIGILFIIGVILFSFHLRNNGWRIESNLKHDLKIYNIYEQHRPKDKK